MSDDGVESELVVPFVACVSQGGPYDDQSFTAGFQCGRVDALLTSAAAIGANHVVATVYGNLREQIDLIAMSHGYTTTSEEWGMSTNVSDTVWEWSTVGFLMDVDVPSGVEE